MPYTRSRFPGVMQLASTSQIQTLNQVIPPGTRGMGDLSFDGSGLLGSGLFGQATWGLPEWGLLLGGGLMLAKAFGIFGGKSGSSGRRKSLKLARAEYELKRAEA